MSTFHHRKYLKIEVIFFFFYFYVFRMLTDFEYNYWERKVVGISMFEIEYNLLYGTSGLIAFWVFYRIVKRYLVHQKVGRLIFLTICFLAIYSVYSKLVSYLFANLDFLSAEMRATAKRNFNFKSIGYSFAYMARELLSMSFLAYFIHSDEQNRQMKLLREQQLLSELTLLKAQLQPHFFFNTLNNIYGLALKQSQHTAPLVAQLADMMRYILYHANEKLVLLAHEVNFIENYVEVEKIRYRTVIQIELETQGIDQTTKIAPLLLLPFVENAFKHGVQDEQHEGFVKIVIVHTNGELTMEISNSIAAHGRAIGGVGLANVRKRLEILYPDRYELHMNNDGKIFTVNLTIHS